MLAEPVVSRRALLEATLASYHLYLMCWLSQSKPSFGRISYSYHPYLMCWLSQSKPSLKPRFSKTEHLGEGRRRVRVRVRVGVRVRVRVGVGVGARVRSSCGAHLQVQLPPASAPLDLVQAQAVVELLLARGALHVILVAWVRGRGRVRVIDR